jgi:hypothetical protein
MIEFVKVQLETEFLKLNEEELFSSMCTYIDAINN